MRLRVLVGLMLTIALLVGPEHAAFGASFTVDTTVDAVDANPGDGVCADSAGGCTLRAAIQETNALPGPDVIALDFATYALAIPGIGEDASATGDLDITDDLTIGAGLIVNGDVQPGAVIDGGGIDRVLHILGDVTVQISGVIIQNGDVTAVFSDVGGILNSSGTVALSDSVVRDNRASGAAGIGNGGSMTLSNVAVSGNFAAVTGGISNFGASATLNLNRSTVSENTGGGIFNGVDGLLTIRRSTIEGNSREGFGGGISNNGELNIADTSLTRNSSGGGALDHRLGRATLTNVTMDGNVAKSAGGAIFIDGDGEMTLVNSTLSGNSALSELGPFGLIPGRGGAVYIHSGSITMKNVTVSDNLADDEAGAIFNVGRGFPFSDPVVVLQNSILAGNTVGGSVANCNRVVISEGHNLEDSDTCGLSAAGDVMNTDARLEALANNGGATQTHALMPGSPAIDAADNSTCPPTDQRGVARPVDGDNDGGAECDIGAYEAPSPTATPSPTLAPTGTPAPTASPGPARLPGTGGITAEHRSGLPSEALITITISFVFGLYSSRCKGREM